MGVGREERVGGAEDSSRPTPGAPRPAYERRWEARRDGGEGGGRSAGDEARDSYYGLPVIHRPQWNWLIVLYFFLGGIAGASYAIAGIARLFDDAESRRIARAGRYLALATLIPSPVLLILDLGRPERFHHMLRVVKIRSPLSVGTWVLTLFGGVCALTALGQAAEDGLLGRDTALARLGRAVPERGLNLLGLAPAFALSGYTGTLLAATAVPLWTKRALLMGPLFLASSMSNATAAIALILALTPGSGEAGRRRLERLETVATVAELALLLAVRGGLGETIARPLVTGRLGRVYRLGVLGIGLGAPLALRAGSIVRSRAPSRAATTLTSALILTGGLLFRYAILYAGRASADDPQATFALARADERRRT